MSVVFQAVSPNRAFGRLSHYGRNDGDGDGNVPDCECWHDESVWQRSVWQCRKMAEALLFWVYLLALWQPCIGTGRWPNRGTASHSSHASSAAFAGVVDCWLGCSLPHRSRFFLHFSRWLAPFELHDGSEQHQEGKAIGRRMYVVYGVKWEDLILTGKRTSTCNIFTCPKRPGISPRRLGST